MAPRVTCECGECHKCKRRIYMREWYAKNADRHRQTAKASRLRRIEAVRAYDRARGKEKNKAVDPVRRRAREYIRNAVYHGRIKRMPCEMCGAEPAHAHHDDYTKPKDVRWLCPTHHGEVHRRVGV